jgi:cytosine permease
MASEPPALSRTTLPGYLQAARPNPPGKRAPWYLSTAPTYAGIFLWFVFWNTMPAQGELATGGLGMALLGIVLAALICHFLFYLVPGLLGMQTGLPLYIVGTSTFGSVGGLLLPGFLMGLLQFGWLAVNTYFSVEALAGSHNSPLFYALCVVWAAAAAFVGLKGIQYVAKVATFLPLIPLAVLLFALVKFGGSAASYQPAPPADAAGGAGLVTLLAMVAQIVGFFATAGAAGVDFGMNSRDRRDVQLGGIVGILIATVFTAGVAVLAVAGAHVQGALQGTDVAAFTVTNGLKAVVSEPVHKAIMVGLTIAAFPGACFSAFIAANSFKTVMPRVNSFASVGVGALVSIALAVTGLAADLPGVFGLIGASFGPICGAMCVDYFLAGRRWTGPRAGFNPAGWVAWLLGFVVGILPNLHGLNDRIPSCPAAPVAAFVVGAVVYFIMAKLRLESPVLPYTQAKEQQPA